MSKAIIRNKALFLEGQNFLSLDGKNFPSDAFDAMLTAFKTTELTIEVDSFTPDAAPSQNFKINGKTTLFTQSVAITLYLHFPPTGALQFQFKAALPSLKLQTLRDNDILPNSQFVGPLLAAEYPDSEVIFDSTGAQLYAACIQSPGKIDLFPKLMLDKMGFEFRRSYVEETVLLDAYAEIKIGTTPIDVKIEIPLGGSLSSTCWSVTSRSSIPLGSWLADLTNFLGQSLGVTTNIFPESVTGIRTFFLDDLQILLDPKNRKILYVSFRIKSVREIKKDSLTISNVGMRVNVSPAATRTTVSVTLFGHIKIKEDANLDLQVTLPPNLTTDSWDFVMSGSVDLKDLNDFNNLPVGHKLEDLHLSQGSLTLTSIELNRFEIAFNPVQRRIDQINFDLALHAVWALLDGLELKDPRFALMAIKPFVEAERSITGSIAGTIAVDDINFAIDATKTTDGWIFSGTTAPEEIMIGRMAAAFLKKYNVAVPQAIQENLKVELLDLQLVTKKGEQSKTVTFNSKIAFPVTKSDTATLQFNVNVTDGATKGNYSHKFSGALVIGSVEFGTRYLDESQAGTPTDGTRTFFVGDYAHKTGKETGIKELVGGVSPALARFFPDGLAIIVKQALFAFAKTGTDSRKFLIEADIGISIDLAAHLPLVGKALTASGAGPIGIDNLQIIFASQPFALLEVEKLNELLSSDPPLRTLPDVSKTTQTGTTPPPSPTTNVINEGVNISAVLNLGGTTRPLAFPTNATPQQNLPTQQAVPNATTADSAIWLDVQKAIGPVHFERVGIEYRDSKLWVLLTASLTAAGLTISLDGLSLGAPVEGFDVSKITPALRGLGLDYRNDFLEIGGSFSAARDVSPPEYTGGAVLKAEALTISAFGSYSTIDGHPSLFIYGLLDYPLGGPPFFFVTGLAAGFGYQRNLLIPPVERVGQFSLITAAQNKSSFANIIASLRKDIPAAQGENFLAAGVIFTSFKLVESTVLLIAQFGKRFALQLVGLSKLRMPAVDETNPATDPVAEVELAVKGSFIPDEGFLELRAVLTPTSYLFSKDCHLTGGFAFICWFTPKDPSKSTGREGDFVLTLGGYHSAFHVPSHYPTVPRLGFNWQIGESLSLRGEVYFALTPVAVMAGGFLQAEWRSGSVYAWFKAGVDFLIAWKPYHYDARAYIDIGVEVTFWFFGTQRLSLDVGADLHIWGPDFSGEATIHLWIISFTIHFGNQQAGDVKHIGWDEFQTSFLLKEKPKSGEIKPDVCSVVVSDGLVQKGEKNHLGTINGKHFCLITDSRIPSTAATLNGAGVKLDDKVVTAVGIPPVGVASVTSSTHAIAVTRDNKPAGQEFEYIPIKKNFPSALWGRSITPELNGPQFVNAFSGFEIRPRKVQESNATAPIDSKVLITNDTSPQHCSWEKAAKPFSAVTRTETDFTNDLKATGKTIRNSLLASLGVDVIGLDDSLIYDFLKQPRSEAA